jgi:hypothetical protein
MAMPRLCALRAIALLFLFVPLFAQAATRACTDVDTLEELADCISRQMPQHRSNDYVVPNAAERADFRAVVTQMLQGQCGFALPASLAGPMRMRSFTDSDNGKPYCLLMEVLDADNDGFVDRGWGTFIVDGNAQRELSQQAPHPKFSTSSSGEAGDSYTEREAIRIFKRTDSRSYLVCGARRSAVAQASSCQRDYELADCAHNVDNMFHAANEALNTFYGTRNWTALQWHGMAESTCNETMFLSIGFDTNPPADSKVRSLRDAIRSIRSGWRVNTPDTACTMNATENPTGRMLNGVPTSQACRTPAASPSHKFLHIEQDVPVLGADLEGVSESWAQAVVTALTPPATPQNLNAVPSSSSSIALSWQATPRATRYILRRGSASGGPYSTVSANLNGTTHNDTGLSPGTTYFYVLLAANSAGESAASNETHATPQGTAQPVALRPIADAYVRDGGKAGTNYGGAKEIQLKGGGSGGTRQGYLKFDLSGIGSVSRAVLRLHVGQNTATSNGMRIDARWVADSGWTEAALVWNNRPATGDSLASATTSGGTAFAWREFDVTAFVQAEKAAGRHVLTLGLTNAASGAAWARARTREAASNRPQLLITP